MGSNAVCVMCDLRRCCRCHGKAQETKAEIGRSAKKKGLTLEAVRYLILCEQGLTECLIKYYKNVRS